MRTWTGCLLATTFCVVVMSVSATTAQEYWEASSGPATSATNASLDSLMQRVAALEAKADDADKKPPADEWKDMSAEKWTFKFGGRVLADYVMFADQDAGNQARFGDIDNYFEWRRLRFRSEGEGYGVYFYRMELEFEPEGEAGMGDSGIAVRDCYVGMREIPWLGTVILGNTKQPMSLEVQNSSNYIPFLERALPRLFVVDERMVGALAVNRIPSEALMWSYGVFFAQPMDEDHEIIGDDPGVRLGWRVVSTPYFCDGGHHLLHLGFGGAWQTVGEEEQWRWRTRPEDHEGPSFLDTGNFDSDSFYTLNFESAVNWGAWSVESEIFYNRNQTPASDIDLYGAYAQVSWFLTGESRPYDRAKGVFERLKPYTNFWLVRGRDGADMGWGAWQLAARWSAVDLRDPAFTGANRGLQHDLTVGINWYWNPHFRWMLNWIHTWNDYDVAVDGYTDGQADILGVRGQLDF